jgi:membrane protein
MAPPDAVPRRLGEIAPFLREAYRRFDEDRCLQIAGSLTYTTLLALVPLLAVSLAVASAFPVFRELTAGVDDWLAENMLPEPIGGAIATAIAQFTENAARLTALGIALLAATALATMLTIERALNRIFRVRRERPIAQRLLIWWAVLTVGPLLLGVSLTVTSYLVSASLGLVKDVPLLAAALLGALPLALEIAAFTLLYLWVPNRRVRLRDALAGGATAGIVFELAKRGFAFYIAHVPTYTVVYGAFATVPIFLLWAYVSWLAVLCGAVIAAMLPGYFGGERRGRAAGQQFLDALGLLGTLADAQRTGSTAPLARLARAHRLAPDECERLLARMEAAGWVAQAGERWLLAREARSVTVADVYRLFVLDAAPADSPLAPLLAAHQRDVAARLGLTLHEVFAEARA